MIAIIDYRAGNLRSVERALRHLGIECRITLSPQEIRSARQVIFPGVGAAGKAMETITSSGLDAVIRETAARGTPFLGICLGLQLLAEALGGRIGVASKPEVGIGEVKLSGLGRRHGMTSGLKPTLKVMQWHHAEVQELPEGAEVLATSPITKVQIMAVADTLLATQFHAELTPALIERWAHIPQYIDWLNEALGPDAYPRVRAKALPLMPQFERMSRTLFNNLIEGKALRQAA